MNVSLAPDPHEHLIAEGLLRCVSLFEQTFDSSIKRARDIAQHIAVGGKKMRAKLVLGVGHFCAIEPSIAVTLATAVESMHMATLLHDDVIDGSIRRRHRPTAHHVWNVESSILGGDFLLAGIFQMLLDVGTPSILNAFARTAKTMAEAELLQMENQDHCHMNPDVCLKVMEGKTASLFAFATQCSALYASSGEKRGILVGELATYGYHLGMAFQMIDDVLDYQASPEDMGKEAFEDWLSGSITLPLAMAYQNGTRQQKATLKTLFKQRQREGVQKSQRQKSQRQSQRLCEIHEHIAILLDVTGALASVRKKAASHGNAALKALKKAQKAMPSSESVVFLEGFVQNILKRKS